MEPYLGRMLRLKLSDPLDPPPGEPLETEETMFAREPKMTPEEASADLAELHRMAEDNPNLKAFLAAYMAVKDDPAEAYDVETVLRNKGLR